MAVRGPSTRLTDHPRGVSQPAWAPDGRTIAFVAAGSDVAGGIVEAEETDPRRRLIRVRGHRHKLEGVGYLDGPLAHLWLVPVVGGDARQLTDGRFQDGEPAWAPDGRAIAFTSDRSADRDRRFGGHALHVVDVATGAVRRLTRDDRFASLPAWSPDGASIAYLRGETTNDVDGHHDRLWVVGRDGGEERCLTAGSDRGLGFRPGGYRTPSRPAWTPDGAAILQIRADAGTTQLVRIAPTGPDAVEPLTEGRHVIGEFSADRDVGGSRSSAVDPVTPPELWAWGAPAAGPGASPASTTPGWSASRSGRRVRVGSTRAGFPIDAWLTLPSAPGQADRTGGPDAGLPLILRSTAAPTTPSGRRCARHPAQRGRRLRGARRQSARQRLLRRGHSRGPWSATGAVRTSRT